MIQQTERRQKNADIHQVETIGERRAGNSDFTVVVVFARKSSCGDLQSRLKVRKMLGVGDTTGSVGSAGSKISQILGHSDNLIFQLPPTLAAWLLLTAGLFGCFTVMVSENVPVATERDAFLHYAGSCLASVLTFTSTRRSRIDSAPFDVLRL